MASRGGDAGQEFWNPLALVDAQACFQPERVARFKDVFGLQGHEFLPWAIAPRSQRVGLGGALGLVAGLAIAFAYRARSASFSRGHEDLGSGWPGAALLLVGCVALGGAIGAVGPLAAGGHGEACMAGSLVALIATSLYLVPSALAQQWLTERERATSGLAVVVALWALSRPDRLTIAGMTSQVGTTELFFYIGILFGAARVAARPTMLLSSTLHVFALFVLTLLHGASSVPSPTQGPPPSVPVEVAVKTEARGHSLGHGAGYGMPDTEPGPPSGPTSTTAPESPPLPPPRPRPRPAKPSGKAPNRSKPRPVQTVAKSNVTAPPPPASADPDALDPMLKEIVDNAEKAAKGRPPAPAIPDVPWDDVLRDLEGAGGKPGLGRCTELEELKAKYHLVGDWQKDLHLSVPAAVRTRVSALETECDILRRVARERHNRGGFEVTRAGNDKTFNVRVPAGFKVKVTQIEFSGSRALSKKWAGVDFGDGTDEPAAMKTLEYELGIPSAHDCLLDRLDGQAYRIRCEDAPEIDHDYNEPVLRIEVTDDADSLVR